jgi:peptidoglycan/LPS O-acetylase OafA/YrhL
MNPTAVRSPKATSEHYIGIQILRGLAALMVVFHHVGQQATLDFKSQLDWLHRGAFGVDLFFPISGFVIYLSTQSMLRKQVENPAREFAFRRLMRIVPLYWFFTLVKAAILSLTMRDHHLRLWSVMASMLFQFSRNREGNLYTVLSVGWTLNYEMLFYAVVLMAILFKKPLLAWCSAVIGVIVVSGFFIPDHSAQSFFAHPIILEFLAGMFVAEYAPRLRGLKPVAGIAMTGLGVTALLIYDPALSIATSPMRALIWGIPGVLIVAGFVAMEDRIPFRSLTKLLLLGDASYALYLSHGFILPVIGKLCSGLHLQAAAVPVFFLISAVCSIGFGVMAHLKIELPLLRKLLHAHLSWSVRSAETANG